MSILVIFIIFELLNIFIFGIIFYILWHATNALNMIIECLIKEGRINERIKKV